VRRRKHAIEFSSNFRCGDLRDFRSLHDLLIALSRVPAYALRQTSVRTAATFRTSKRNFASGGRQVRNQHHGLAGSILGPVSHEAIVVDTGDNDD
jgi:hypothetical protein